MSQAASVDAPEAHDATARNGSALSLQRSDESSAAARAAAEITQKAFQVGQTQLSFHTKLHSHDRTGDHFTGILTFNAPTGSKNILPFHV